MASFNIHLAIAKKYAEKNHIEDLKAFYDGTVDPDLVDDKNKSHYTGVRNKTDLLNFLALKVQLPRFLSNNNIKSDYDKGTFLHLVTDYLFFNDFFDKDYLKGITHDEFLKDLYYSYDNINLYLINKYKLDITQIEDKLNDNIKNNKEANINSLNKGNKKDILEQTKLDKFIEKTSSINLEEYAKKILHYNKNVLP